MNRQFPLLSCYALLPHWRVQLIQFLGTYSYTLIYQFLRMFLFAEEPYNIGFSFHVFSKKYKGPLFCALLKSVVANSDQATSQLLLNNNEDSRSK